MNKKILIPLLAIPLIAGASVLTISKSYADEESQFSPMIQRLVERFNLDENKVSEVIGEYREENKERRMESMEERLNTLVSENKLTEEQKVQLLEILKNHEPNENRGSMNFEDRETYRTELETWATEQGLDLSELQIGFGMPKGEMGEGRKMRGNN